MGISALHALDSDAASPADSEWVPRQAYMPSTPDAPSSEKQDVQIGNRLIVTLERRVAPIST